MHDELHMVRHNPLSVRDTESTRAVPILAYRAIKCRVNTLRARLKPTRTDTSENPAVPIPLDAIGPKEVERPIGKCFDWTRDWDFLLSMRTYSEHGKQWMADACLYFKGLRPWSSDAIPWNDLSITERVESDPIPSRHGGKCLKASWKFCERADRPRWGAIITIYYQKTGVSATGISGNTVLMTLENPWNFFTRTQTAL